MIKKIFVLFLCSLLYGNESSPVLTDLQKRFDMIMKTDREKREMYYPSSYKLFIPSRIDSLNTLLSQLKKIPQDDITFTFEAKLNAALTAFQIEQDEISSKAKKPVLGTNNKRHKKKK